MLGIIPAAGKGTRIEELGKYCPKAILPFHEKPLIYYNISWLIEQGCDKILIIVSEDNKDQIEKSVDFHVDSFGKVEIIYFVQKELTGLGGAIKSVYKFIDRPVLIVLGDIVVNPDEELKFSYNQSYLGVKKVKGYSRWCMVDESGVFYDKPNKRPPTEWALSGIYYIKQYSKLKRALKMDVPQIAGEYQISSYLEKADISFKLVNFDVTDFGTLSEYLKNRGIPNHRSFNEVYFDPQNKTVYKRSDEDPAKIFKEIVWYSFVKNEFDDIIVYTPRLLSDVDFFCKNQGYMMEYLTHPSLRELRLFFGTNLCVWELILENIIHVKKVTEILKFPNISPVPEIISKIKSRINRNNPSDLKVEFMIQRLREIGSVIDKDSYFLHGDMCFSNILYDVGQQNLYLLDPRGDLMGSRYYDWAKICQSVFYHYDHIDSGLFYANERGEFLGIEDSNANGIVELFYNRYIQMFTPLELEYIDLLTASLFLTMIPLHSDTPVHQKIYRERFECIVNKYYMFPVGTQASQFSLMKYT